MESKTSNQEVDLLEVLAKLYSYLRENIFLTILFPLAGAVAGFFMFPADTDKIESSMMVVTNLLTSSECDFLLTQLEMADSFPGVSPEQRGELIIISHEIITDPEVKFSPLKPPNVHLKITGQVQHHEMLRVFENSIITYLEASRPAIKKKYESHELNTTMIAEIERELASLQQLKTQTDPKVIANSFNPSSLYTETVALTEKKIIYELSLKNNNVFQLIQGFDVMSRSTKLSRTMYILLGFGAGFAALLLALFIKYFWGYYRQYRQSHQS